MTFGNYGIRTPVRIWKRYIPLLRYRSFNFQQLSSMTFFCATHILQVTGRQSIQQSTDFFTDFLT